jgi:hypothetical protein
MLVASSADPERRVVVLLARIWHRKILVDHPEMAAHLEALIGTVTTPEHVTPDQRDGPLALLPPPCRSQSLVDGGRKL